MRCLILFIFVAIAYAHNAKSTESCYAYRSGNLFIIGNEVISQRFVWNNGNLQLIEVKDKIKGKAVGYTAAHSVDGEVGDLVLPDVKAKPVNGRLEQKITAKSEKESEYLQVNVFFDLNEIRVKRVFKVYPGTAAIASHFEFKGKGALKEPEIAKAGYGSKEMIEDANYKAADVRDAPVMGSVPLNSNHWKFRFVEFTEATDHNNTLVQEDTYLAYRRPARVQGNLVLARNKSLETGFFMEQMVSTWLEAGQEIALVPFLGEGSAGSQQVTDKGSLTFRLPEKNSWCLYKYEVQNTND